MWKFCDVLLWSGQRLTAQQRPKAGSGFSWTEGKKYSSLLLILIHFHSYCNISNETAKPPTLLATCFCVGLPKSSEQAYIEFESIEAIVKTASRTKFFIEFYSTCLEGEMNIHSKSTRSYSAHWVDVIKLYLFLLFVPISLPPSLPISGSQYTFKLESIVDLCCTPSPLIPVRHVLLNEMQ